MRNVDGRGVCVVSLLRKYSDPLHIASADVEDVVVRVDIGCRTNPTTEERGSHRVESPKQEKEIPERSQ